MYRSKKEEGTNTRSVSSYIHNVGIGHPILLRPVYAIHISTTQENRRTRFEDPSSPRWPRQSQSVNRKQPLAPTRFLPIEARLNIGRVVVRRLAHHSGDTVKRICESLIYGASWTQSYRSLLGCTIERVSSVLADSNAL